MPLLADLLCVLALALGGRNTHDSGSAWVVLVLAWPFAVAAVGAHAVLLMLSRPPRRLWPAGVSVIAVTYSAGILLRALAGRGMEGGFLVIAALFLAVTMSGWRAVVQLVESRRNG